MIMAYRSYQRGRRGYAPSAGRVSKPNRRPGPCRGCGEEIPAGAGDLWREADGSWSVAHVPESQGGWLMNPQPVRGGCPRATDERNAELHAHGFFGPDAPAPVSEREHIAAMARRFAASAQGEAPRGRRGGYADECGSCGMASCGC
jgi:hypothetical protein